MTYFTEEQVSLLLKPIHPNRVLQRDGMSYVEGYDICAELNRVFGFGRWDVEVLDQVLLREAEVTTRGGKPAWYVVYRSRVRLTVKAPDGTPLSVQEGTHVGESTHPVYGEAHGNAVTNSETYALKRCAKNFGDQFGLSLYNKGSVQPLVRWTLVRPVTAETPADTDDVPQVTAEEGTAPAAEDAITADLSAWETRIAAAKSTDDLDAINGDAHRMFGGGEITAADATWIKGMLDARAMEFRKPRNQGPRPERQEPAQGRVSRPETQQGGAPAGEPPDPDAQALADEASQCRALTDLQAVYKRAHDQRKLQAWVADPGTGVKGKLAAYLNFRKKAIAEVDAALAELDTATRAVHMDPGDVDIHVKKVTGVSIDEAGAAQLRQAAQAVKAAA